MPRTPRLPDTQAFEVIAKAIRDGHTKQADIVRRLEQAGASHVTAYRQVKRFFTQGRGERFIPYVELARVQLLDALETEVVEARKNGVLNPAAARLYAEATGVLEPPSEAVNEPARLKAAAEAIAVLRGLDNQGETNAKDK